MEINGEIHLHCVKSSSMPSAEIDSRNWSGEAFHRPDALNDRQF